MTCPCCGLDTINEKATFETCPVCHWEDDGQGDSDADIITGGPNGNISLTTARENYREIGACHKKHLKKVRPPHDHEKRPEK